MLMKVSNSSRSQVHCIKRRCPCRFWICSKTAARASWRVYKRESPKLAELLSLLDVLSVLIWFQMRTGEFAFCFCQLGWRTSTAFPAESVTKFE